MRIFQNKADNKVLVDIMGECVFLECIAVRLEYREMHKRITEFVKDRDKASKIHLACHLEVEEVAVNVDAPLHKVVVEDGSIKAVHTIASSPITINGVVEVKLAFEVVDVEAFQVGHNVRADFRNGVILDQFQGFQVCVVDHRFKVGDRVFLVVEVNQSVEVEAKHFVVDGDSSLESVFLQIAVKHNLINAIAYQFSLISLSP